MLKLLGKACSGNGCEPNLPSEAFRQFAKNNASLKVIPLITIHYSFLGTAFLGGKFSQKALESSKAETMAGLETSALFGSSGRFEENTFVLSKVLSKAALKKADEILWKMDTNIFLVDKSVSLSNLQIIHHTYSQVFKIQDA